MVLTSKIDTHNLNFAQGIFNDYGRTVPALATNRTALFVIRTAQKNTPFVTQSEVDEDLDVEVVPRIGKRGKPLSTKFARNRLYRTSGAGSGAGEFSAVPLTWLIISARAKAGSSYNLATSSRWMIGQGVHPLKGHSVAEFAGIMQEIENRMVKARHSSTHFLQTSWTDIIQKLLPFVPAAYRSGLGAGAGNNAIDGTGAISPAKDGYGLVTCRVDNLLGMAGIGDELDARRNAAAHRILEPVLQRAIDQEFDSKMAEAGRRGWLDRAGKLRALGFVVA